MVLVEFDLRARPSLLWFGLLCSPCDNVQRALTAKMMTWYTENDNALKKDVPKTTCGVIYLNGRFESWHLNKENETLQK